MEDTTVSQMCSAPARAGRERNAAVNLVASLHQTVSGILQTSAVLHLHHLQFDVQASLAVLVVTDVMEFSMSGNSES